MPQPWRRSWRVSRNGTSPRSPNCWTDLMQDVRVRPAAAEDLTFLATMLGEAAVWRPDKPTPTADQVLSDRRYALYLVGWPRQGDYGLVAEQGGPTRPSTKLSHYSTPPCGRISTEPQSWRRDSPGATDEVSPGCSMRRHDHVHRASAPFGRLRAATGGQKKGQNDQTESCPHTARVPRRTVHPSAALNLSSRGRSAVRARPRARQPGRERLANRCVHR